MDTEHYKQMLLKEETQLLEGLTQEEANAREVGDQPTGDTTDRIIQGEGKEEQFQDAELNRTLLLQVQDALRRIEEGTYGKCAVDGGPIDEKRLEAMPWTPYCIRHQRPIEAAHPPHTPTM